MTSREGNSQVGPAMQGEKVNEMKMKKLSLSIWPLAILLGTALIHVSLAFAAAEVPASPIAVQASQEEISGYSSFIERYVNQNWKKENASENGYKVTLLEVTRRERVDLLKGQFNYCLVMLQLGREIHECVACFWQPDQPANPETPFEFKGIFEMGKKLII